eukprot:1041915-Amphidinium_carterae.2
MYTFVGNHCMHFFICSSGLWAVLAVPSKATEKAREKVAFPLAALENDKLQFTEKPVLVLHPHQTQQAIHATYPAMSQYSGSHLPSTPVTRNSCTVHRRQVGGRRRPNPTGL